MLARVNRLVKAEDYRGTVRRGRRAGTRNTVVYVIHRQDVGDPRFGFIVSKAVGNAVARNTIRRRLKAVCREVLSQVAPGTDVVIRALPGSASAEWPELRSEVSEVLTSSSRAPQQQIAKERLS